MKASYLALAAGFCLGLAAGCANFDDDLNTYCAARRCDNGKSCCDGYTCAAGACVKVVPSDGGGGSCSPACSGATPYCGIDNRCHSCAGTQGCASGKVCDLAADAGFGACVTCSATEGCPTGQSCDTTASGGQGRCVTCTAVRGCAPPASICDTSVDGGVCYECIPDAGNCTGAAPLCSPTTRRCVTCEKNTDCTLAGTPVCDTALNSGKGACVRCTSTQGCAGGTVCDTSGAPQCVECVDNSQCAGKPGTTQCHALQKRCVECNSDAPCLTTGRTCNIPLGQCQVGGADAGYPPATRINLVNPNPTQALGAGQCAPAAWTMEAQDATLKPTLFGGSISLVGTGGARFFTAAGCAGSPMSSFLLPAGSSSLPFYVSFTGVGTQSVTSSAAGLSPGSASATVVAGSPAYFAFTGTQNVPAGACSSQSTVSAYDAFGNLAPSSNAFSLTSSNANASFYGSNTCTGAPLPFPLQLVGGSFSFYFVEKISGQATHTASGNGMDAGSVIHTVMPGSPNLRVTVTNKNVPSGGCSNAIQLAARDAYGNLAPYPGPVALSSSSPSGTFFGDGNCLNMLPSPWYLQMPYTDAVISYRDTANGTFFLSARPSGAPADAGVAYGDTVTFGAAATDPLSIRFDTASQSLSPAGKCSDPVTVTFLNGSGAGASWGSPQPISVTSSTAPDLVAWAAGSNCTVRLGSSLPAGSSTFSFTFSTRKASVPGNPSTHDLKLTVGPLSAQQPQTVYPGPASRLALFGQQFQPANVCSPSPLQVGITDDFGNPTPTTTAISVGLSSPDHAATMSFSTLSTCGSSTGTLFFSAGQQQAGFFLQDTQNGQATVKATTPGLLQATLGMSIGSAACAGTGGPCGGSNPATCCAASLACNSGNCCLNLMQGCTNNRECCSGYCSPTKLSCE